MHPKVHTTDSPSDARHIRRAIRQQRDRVFEHSLAVDDARAAVDGSVAGLYEAVREHDCAAAHLAHLVAYLADLIGTERVTHTRVHYHTTRGADMSGEATS
jgi:hypothetical protein